MSQKSHSTTFREEVLAAPVNLRNEALVTKALRTTPKEFPRTRPLTRMDSGGVLVLGERRAARSSPAVSSARNTIETFFDSTKPSLAWELCLSSTRPRGRRCCETRHLMGEKAAMKRCAQCHGKLGLGVRSPNLWNGRWWAHVRFCSVHCEDLYKPEQRQRTSQTHRPRSP